MIFFKIPTILWDKFTRRQASAILIKDESDDFVSL